MGILQSSGPLGVMIGYSTIATFYTITHIEKAWRIGFAFLFIFATITSTFFFMMANENIDVLSDEKQERAVSETHVSSSQRRLPIETEVKLHLALLLL